MCPGVLHAAAELNRPPDGLFHPRGSMLQVTVQRVEPAAGRLDILHADAETSVHLGDEIGLNDIRVAFESDPDLGLLAKLPQQLGSLSRILAERLEGILGSGFLVLDEVDDAVPPAPMTRRIL